MVEGAARAKAPTERLITRLARFYTPAVVAIAALIAFVPPLVVPGARLGDWVYRALIMLVISCPCALMVSVPLGYFGGIGGASRRGILVKGAAALDTLAAVRTVVFDKTGTLTKGVFRVVRIEPAEGTTGDALLTLAAGAESHSNHPIAQSIREAWRSACAAGSCGRFGRDGAPGNRRPRRGRPGGRPPGAGRQRPADARRGHRARHLRRGGHGRARRRRRTLRRPPRHRRRAERRRGGSGGRPAPARRTPDRDAHR